MEPVSVSALALGDWMPKVAGEAKCNQRRGKRRRRAVLCRRTSDVWNLTGESCEGPILFSFPHIKSPIILTGEGGAEKKEEEEEEEETMRREGRYRWNLSRSRWGPESDVRCPRLAPSSLAHNNLSRCPAWHSSE